MNQKEPERTNMMTELTVLGTLSQKFPPTRTMNLLIATTDSTGTFIIRVPHRHLLETEMGHLETTYGGVYAMNIDRFFFDSHNCYTLFDMRQNLLELSKTARIIVLIPTPDSVIRTMYEERRCQEPLFMVDRALYLAFVKSVLILEYSSQPLPLSLAKP